MARFFWLDSVDLHRNCTPLKSLCISELRCYGKICVSAGSIAICLVRFAAQPITYPIGGLEFYQARIILNSTIIKTQFQVKTATYYVCVVIVGIDVYARGIVRNSLSFLAFFYVNTPARKRGSS